MTAIILTSAAISVPGSSALGAPVAGSAPDEGVLDRPANGAMAVRELGDRLPRVAAINGLGTDELRGLLRTDKTAWVDTSGRLLYIDTALPRERPAEKLAEGPYPHSETFLLHSNPGALRVIYLDFNGHVVSGTAWNSFGVGTATQPSFDLDGDPGSFSTTEQDAIQSIWQRVSEDYAPFDVDVTTQEPASAEIERSGSSDQEYGTRVLISPSSQAQQAICPSGCGGVAYLDVYDLTSSHSYYQPAWVFPHMLSQNTKYIAEAVSHEAGHNLDLNHDGLTSGSAYYQGHGSWAPIMGVGYYKPIVHWSAGEYTGANNTEDDIAIIASNGPSIKSDDHGNGMSTATPINGTGTQNRTGSVGTRSDQDYFALSRSCSGTFSASAAPGPTSPNLDIRLRLLNSAGQQLGAADPGSYTVNYDRAGGMSASIGTTLGSGTYFLEVDGVGALNPASTGYSDYGSAGAYSVQVSGCQTTTVPGVPTSVATSKNDPAKAATISWQPPSSDGGSPITGYRVSRDGTGAQGGGPWSTIVSASTRSFTFRYLAAGSTYNLSVEAINAVGTGPAATGTVTLAGATNLLRNASFELDANGDGRPDTWSSNAKFRRTNTAVYAGSFAGRHQATDNGGHTILQGVSALTAARAYTIGGYVNVPATADAFTFKLQVRWRNSANRVLRTNTIKTYSAPTGGWNFAGNNVTAPTGTTNAQVVMVATSLKATIHVDGFRFAG